MTAASGDSGEKPDTGSAGPSYGGDPAPPAGGYEAPPIEQTPAYGGYPPPPPPPPGYGGYPGAGPGYEAPGGFPPPPGYPPQYGPGPGPYPPADYGNPYQGGYGVPAAESGTNPMAIFSLVASVTGLLCGVGSVIGIVLGVLALNQIKRTRQGGYGLAVAGIVVGVASLIISLVWMIYAMS